MRHNARTMTMSLKRNTRLAHLVALTPVDFIALQSMLSSWAARPGGLHLWGEGKGLGARADIDVPSLSTTTEIT